MTTISFADAERGAGYPARSRNGNHERTYRRAMRHSRHVRWMRATLIAAVSLVLLAVAVDNYCRRPADFGCRAKLAIW